MKLLTFSGTTEPAEATRIARIKKMEMKMETVWREVLRQKLA